MPALSRPTFVGTVLDGLTVLDDDDGLPLSTIGSRYSTTGAAMAPIPAALVLRKLRIGSLIPCLGPAADGTALARALGGQPQGGVGGEKQAP